MDCRILIAKEKPDGCTVNNIQHTEQQREQMHPTVKFIAIEFLFISRLLGFALSQSLFIVKYIPGLPVNLYSISPLEFKVKFILDLQPEIQSHHTAFNCGWSPQSLMGEILTAAELATDTSPWRPNKSKEMWTWWKTPKRERFSQKRPWTNNECTTLSVICYFFT